MSAAPCEWGTPVVASDKAVTKGVLKTGCRGIVLRAEGLRLWVAVEGRRTVSTWHRDFWEVSR